jgi:hypothetical protein
MTEVKFVSECKVYKSQAWTTLQLELGVRDKVAWKG